MIKYLKFRFKKFFNLFEAGDLIEYNSPIYHSECGYEWEEEKWNLGIFLHESGDYFNRYSYYKAHFYSIQDQRNWRVYLKDIRHATILPNKHKR